MCFFDSPLARCETVHELVLTDQTQPECAHQHDCPPDQPCPLRSYFTDISGLVEEEMPGRKLPCQRR